MRVLLDTHAMLWWLADEQLSADVSALIAEPDNQVFVSAASIWEVAIKRSLGKLTAPDGLPTVVAEEGFSELAISGAHAEQAGGLPRHHRDPFDRVLIAQAQIEQVSIVTRDPVFASYDVAVLSC